LERVILKNDLISENTRALLEHRNNIQFIFNIEKIDELPETHSDVEVDDYNKHGVLIEDNEYRRGGEIRRELIESDK